MDKTAKMRAVEKQGQLWRFHDLAVACGLGSRLVAGGAKGLGEMPMSGGGPAVANAVAHALGVRVVDLPVSPERIFAALQRREGRPS